MRSMEATRAVGHGIGRSGAWAAGRSQRSFFFFFGQILCNIYDEEICKILTIKKKKKTKKSQDVGSNTGISL